MSAVADSTADATANTRWAIKRAILCFDCNSGVSRAIFVPIKRNEYSINHSHKMNLYSAAYNVGQRNCHLKVKGSKVKVT